MPDVEIRELENVVIVGSGPAGLTAAIYASRANLFPLLVEGYPGGGQLMETTDVENFPGYPEAVKGPDLINDLKQQALRFGTRFLASEIVSFNLNGDVKELTTDMGLKIKTRAVILGTGASARYLGMENETKLKGYGVSACAVCDGFFYRNQHVAVIGGGDSALEDALFLTKHAEKVYIVHRRDEFRASKIMQQRALSNPKVQIVWNSVVDDLVGEPDKDGLTALRLRNTKTDEVTEISVTGMFVAVGHDPNTTLFANQVELDKAGFIKTSDNTSHTNIPGVFACGDVMDPRYKQAITAAGSGCKAALDTEKWLIEMGYE
ncbi:thioredoxin-disulfide reductase [Myxococcota bacterium]|nr:thioredoxin-disulfide reductase [Myxococcota bacterium]MBU1379732.1 thioredoxin-disulfide reductase [Myxococcota bacterium]MBU1496884.1 thioredoxin-disulfide reductase [Myxococcota bacterium]